MSNLPGTILNNYNKLESNDKPTRSQNYSKKTCKLKAYKNVKSKKSQEL